MKEYLSGEEIISQHGIELFQLYKFVVEHGLTPYSTRTGQPIKILSTDQANLWRYTQKLNLLLGKIKTSLERFAVHQICSHPPLLIDLLDGKNHLERELDAMLAIKDPTLPAKQTIKKCKNDGKELSKVEEDHLINYTIYQHKKHIKFLKKAISDLKAKGTELPQVEILEWPDLLDKIKEHNIIKGMALPNLPKSTLSEELDIIILDNSEKTFARLKSAKYKQIQFLKNYVKLPDHCPNKTDCFNVASALEKSNSCLNKDHPFSHPCLDSNDPHHSKKLAIAIGCWTAIYINGYKGTGKRKDRKPLTTSKHHAEAWIRENHPTLSDNAISSILLVVISDEDQLGGAPKTSG